VKPTTAQLYLRITMFGKTEVNFGFGESHVFRGPGVTGPCAHGASTKLKDTIRKFSRPSDQVNEDCMISYADHQSKGPLDHCATAGTGLKPTTHEHTTLRTSPSLMFDSTGKDLLHNLAHNTGASSGSAKSLMAPSPCTDLVQDLTGNLVTTLGTSQSAMPALSDSLSYLLTGQEKTDEPAVSWARCHEQIFEDSMKEVPKAAHHQQCQQPNPTYDRAGKITTLIIRNIPMSCTTSMLIDELHRQGFQGVYNFFYRPVDHQSRHQRPCAFVNFASPTIATAFYLKMHGRFLECGHDQGVPLEVLASNEQGLEANTTRYFTRKCEKNQRFRARPMFPATDPHQILKIEACARRLLIGEPTVAAVGAQERSRHLHAQDYQF